MPLPVITSPHKNSVISSSSPGSRIARASLLISSNACPMLSKNARRFIRSYPAGLKHKQESATMTRRHPRTHNQEPGVHAVVVELARNWRQRSRPHKPDILRALACPAKDLAVYAEERR